jgi:hypothetical protein
LRFWAVVGAGLGRFQYSPCALLGWGWYREMMPDEQESEGNERNVKRPAVSPFMFEHIKAIAGKNSVISPDRIGWEKCLKIVIDEYVPGHEHEKTTATKRLRDKQENSD